MQIFVVTTPLVAERCDSEAEVADLIREYMEGKEGARLDNVSVIEVPSHEDIDKGIHRSPADFWP